MPSQFESLLAHYETKANEADQRAASTTDPVVVKAWRRIAQNYRYIAEYRRGFGMRDQGFQNTGAVQE